MRARRAFSPADAKEARLLLEQRRRPDGGGYFYQLNGARYEDGYLLRSYALKNLQAEEALPPLEDLQRFNQARCARFGNPLITNLSHPASRVPGCGTL